MRRLSCVLCVLISACSFSSKLTTSGFGSGNGAGGGSSGPSASEPSRTVTVPDLYGMTMDQARAALRAAGITREPDESAQNNACDTDRRAHYDQGTICYQHPAPGAQSGSRLPVSVRIQHDLPDHGNIGFAGEWRTMPDVVGKSVTDARGILSRASLPLDEHFELLEGDCARDTICDGSPRPGDRKVLSRKGRLWVGKAAPEPPPTGTQPATTGTQPTTNPPDKDPYF